jgi:predicted ATPase
MKIKVKNLGVLKQAEFTLGNLTILCGCNNTGKTYATYALFGFLSTWQQMFSFEISNDTIDQLLADGVIHLDIQEYVKQFEEMIIKACQNYTQQLPNIFATSTERFINTEFQVETNINNITFRQKFERTIGSTNTEMSNFNTRRY